MLSVGVGVLCLLPKECFRLLSRFGSVIAQRVSFPYRGDDHLLQKQIAMIDTMFM